MWMCVEVCVGRCVGVWGVVGVEVCGYVCGGVEVGVVGVEVCGLVSGGMYGCVQW